MSFSEFQSSLGDNQKDFLYSVLNLPTCASPSEIRERHRALSVIFHPDKQHDDRARATAAKRFLEIQKAYEVLSDPFLREVYDALGEEGLAIRWSATIRSKPTDELRDELRKQKHHRTQTKLESLIQPRGRLSCGINAVSLFERYPEPPGVKWAERVFHRLQGVHLSSFAIRHSVQKAINEKTRVSAWARLSRQGGSGALFGTVKHQYSPRWSFGATGAFLDPRVVLQSEYRDDESAVVIQARISRLFPPPWTVSVSRRLFRDSLTEGVLSFGSSPLPHVTIGLLSPKPFDLTSEYRDTSEDIPNDVSGLGSVSGFDVGTRYWSYAIGLAGVSPSLKGEWGVSFTELAVQVKLGLEFGLEGLVWMLTGTWASKTSEVSACVGLAVEGVFLRLELAYVEQRVSIPIILSQDADAGLALCTAIVPCTALVLGYHFILKPRRLAERAEYFRAAREAVDDEKSSTWREARESASLLKETAKRHMQTERLKGGLVIIEASYGPSEPDEEGKALVVDVTVAVQALVHNSQLHVAGQRSKRGIQGFYDPAPKVAKTLRIRYLFGGRAHYAEIADCVPVVLPLEDHLVPEGGLHSNL